MALLKEAYPDFYAQMVEPDPTLTHGTDKKVSWQCEEGHIWEARPRDRIRGDRPGGCPECSRRTYGIYLIAQKFWSSEKIESVKLGIVSKKGDASFDDCVDARLRRLQVGNAHELYVLKTFPGMNYFQEQKIHKELDDIRANGEWFYVGGCQKTLDRIIKCCTSLSA